MFDLQASMKQKDTRGLEHHRQWPINVA